MSRKEVQREMIIYPTGSLAPGKLAGKARYADENEKFVIDIVWDNEFVHKERSTLLVTSTKNEKSIIVSYLSDKYVE